jgi:CheY-like chemotaxis protein
MRQERQPYYYLDGLLNLLVVDDDPGIRSLVANLLSPVRLYSVKTVSSASEALNILKQPSRVHLCLFDLGLCDIENDEYFLLRKFAARTSFVVFTGSTSPAKGWTARDLGARDIIEKSPELDLEYFLKKINRHALMTVINPAVRLTNDSLSASTAVLFNKSPGNVSRWASEMGITDRELRHLWSTHLGANAKIILSIYQIFTSAFAWYEKNANGAAARMQRPSSDSRLEEYYHMHRSTINDFISYGNISLGLT